jgi:hypothetical protein
VTQSAPSYPPYQAAPAPAYEGLISWDVPCRKCHYNLRGLNAGGVCPECGTPISFSMQQDQLEFCDPHWLDKLHRGTVLVLIGIGIAVLGGVVGGLLGGSRRGGDAQPITLVIGLATYVCNLIGSWLMTEPDPSGLGEDRYGTSRKIIRFTLLAGVVAQAIELVTAVVTISSEVATALLVVGVLLGIVGLVGFYAQFLYLAQLARRIPDDRLAARARFLMWAFTASYAVLILMGGVLLLMGAGGGARSSGLMVFGCTAGIAGLALLVFAIMAILMLDRFRRQFRDVAARSNYLSARLAQPGTAPVAPPYPPQAG